MGRDGPDAEGRGLRPTTGQGRYDAANGAAGIADYGAGKDDQWSFGHTMPGRTMRDRNAHGFVVSIRFKKHASSSHATHAARRAATKAGSGFTTFGSLAVGS